jgi:phenylacetate-CoA ligase
MALLFRTGPAQYIPITAGLDRQWAWLTEFDPDTLLIYPSTLAALARLAEARGETLPGLHHIWTIGETLPPATRALAAAVFGPAPVDLYSSQEVGIIALQCPDSGLYHVAAECVLVEVLDERGAPCGPGEVGRVTVTDLRNFATPLIRYDIGDYAEASSPCACGRGLPTLARILGRERNLILMPDGARHWPLVGFARFRDAAPVAQYQLVQRERERIEVRLVVESPLAPGQEAALGAVIREALGHDFALTFTYFPDRIPPSKGGKFEEFVCEVA